MHYKHKNLATIPSGSWEHGLCSCFTDCSICKYIILLLLLLLYYKGLLTWCCPCIQSYRVAEAIPGGEPGWCFLLAYCTPLKICYGPHALRSAVRQHKGIRGSLFEDWCYAYYCGPCSLNQVALVNH